MTFDVRTGDGYAPDQRSDHPLETFHSLSDMAGHMIHLHYAYETHDELLDVGLRRLTAAHREAHAALESARLTRQTEAPPGPRTEAGRKMHDLQHEYSGETADAETFCADLNLILAIEAEAATAERERADALNVYLLGLAITDADERIEREGRGAELWVRYIADAYAARLRDAALTGGPSDG